MMQDTRVLIIDNDIQRREKLKLLMEFIGEDAQTIDYNNFQADLFAISSDALPSLIVLAHDDNVYLQRAVEVCVNASSPSAIIILEDPLQEIVSHDAAINNDSQDTGSDNTASQQAESISDTRIVARWSGLPDYNIAIDDLHRAQIYFSQNRDLATQEKQTPLFRSLVGASRSMQSVRRLMAQVADSDVTVLVTGESGTGKEVVARNLHNHSGRCLRPFVPVNCGAIPPELLESELFGHEKGSFTGAISTRAGRFELAEGGTLFLDEIGDMPLSMQVKILRVLQERTFERVGGNKTFDADVRIVAATHKNLETMIKQGDFREDLYYRLNVFPIEVPALRERVDDLPLLLNDLSARLVSQKRGRVRFNSIAIMSLCQHPWAGNIRELANLVERMSIMYPREVIGLAQLPPQFRHLEMTEADGQLEQFSEEGRNRSTGYVDVDTQLLLPADGLDLKAYIANLEQNLIQQALDDSGGVVARAAERLRMRRTTLVEKMRKYELQRASQPA